MSRLTLSTQKMAPEAIRWLVAGAIAKNGFRLNLIGVLSNLPQALQLHDSLLHRRRHQPDAGRRDVSACRPRHDHAEVTRGRSLATAKAPTCQSSRVGVAVSRQIVGDTMTVTAVSEVMYIFHHFRPARLQWRPGSIGAVPYGRTVRRSRDGGAPHLANRVNPTEN